MPEIEPSKSMSEVEAAKLYPEDLGRSSLWHALPARRLMRWVPAFVAFLWLVALACVFFWWPSFRAVFAV